MIGVAAVWLFLCIPQCYSHNATKAVTGVSNESLKLTEKESQGQIKQETVSINGNLKSVLKEVPPEAKTQAHSSNMERRSSSESESNIVADNYHHSEFQTTQSTHSFEESPVSGLKIPEIFAPIKDKHKKHEEIKPIHKLKSFESNSPTRVTLIEHTSTIHVQEAKVQFGIPKDVLDEAIKTEKTDKIEDATDNKNLPDTPEVSNNIEKLASDEEIQLEKGPEPPSPTDSQPVEPPTENGDNMPSFNEWTQKRLAEQEQKESNVPTSASSQGKTTPPKMRQKNYASADCGAKILGSNVEAQSAYAVLNGYHDEYMLNPCTAKIWLVIELCEPIQAKKIEVANFELFSSSPREFTVSSSDRFPTREWVMLGNFEAKEEKNIQSFSLEQKMFHKFIKIELFSHYGSEHYCPLSLVRLYGTSELEVLDNDDDHSPPGSHDLDGDGLPDDYETPGELQSPNLFGSAKDAVMSIVKKAAEALSRDKNAQEVPQNNITLSNATENIDSNVFLSASPNITDQCITVVQSAQHESNVNDSRDVEKMLSCSYYFLTNLLALETVNEILSTCSLCNGSSDPEISNVSHVQRKCIYLQVLIGPVRFSALCNLFKINRSSTPLILTETELKLYPNVTEITPGFETLGIDDTMSATSTFENIDESTSTLHCENAESSIPSPEIASETPPLPESGTVVSSPDLPNGIVNSSQSLKELIQPTKTLKPDDIGGDLVGASEDIIESGKSSILSQEVPDHVEVSEKEQDHKVAIEDSSSSSQITDGDTSVVTGSENLPDIVDKTVTASSSESSILDLITSDLTSSEFISTSDGIESSIPPVAQTTSLPPGTKKDIPSTSVTGSSGVNKTIPSNAVTSNTQKESVFVRLSNRIKALELNMSFSSQYLEELSQRYRKQMEEMQKAFNKTISALNETAKKAQEQDVKQQEIINTLQSQIDNLSITVDILLADRESLGAKILEPHVFIIFVELMLAAFMYALLRRHSVRYLRSLNISGDEDIPINNLVQVPRLNGSEDSLVKRRNSFSGCSSSYNKPQRRPSEEALNISGTYADLMIVEPVIPIMVDQLKMGESKRKKQRHKKNSRGSIDEALDENCMNFHSNLSRKQSVFITFVVPMISPAILEYKNESSDDKHKPEVESEAEDSGFNGSTSTDSSSAKMSEPLHLTASTSYEIIESEEKLIDENKSFRFPQMTSSFCSSTAHQKKLLTFRRALSQPILPVKRHKETKRCQSANLCRSRTTDENENRSCSNSLPALIEDKKIEHKNKTINKDLILTQIGEPLRRSLSKSSVLSSKLSSKSLILPPLTVKKSSLRQSSSLPCLRIHDARKRNYLVGNLESKGALLGAVELERHFPSGKMSLFVATWNVHRKCILDSLDDLLLPHELEHIPDMYVVGIEEAAFPNKQDWELKLQETIGLSHVLFHSASLGALHLSVFLRRELIWFCSVAEESSFKLNVSVNTKGAVAIQFLLFGTSFLFLCSHLTAHVERLNDRIQDYKKIVSNINLPDDNLLRSRKRKKELFDKYDCVFWMGDLNFRLNQKRDVVLSQIHSIQDQLNPNFDDILWNDQLKQTMSRGEIFKGFNEGRINFMPTYKYNAGTNEFDTSEKLRTPSYTVRSS
uniref:SUN domain-containing protein n=1 Tax=Strigamia maritima TaxID=126957 RepID=T1J7S8_STRMM